MRRDYPVLSYMRRLSLFVLLMPLLAYRRWISPALPAHCRFYPSCATYAEQALRIHGPLRGSWLAIRRLGRCHPWTPGGVDHVPLASHRAPTGAAAPSTGATTSTPVTGG